MRKKVKKWEFGYYLMKIKLDQSCNLPFAENYFTFETNEKDYSLYGYLTFLKFQLESYRNVITLGEWDFQKYLNNKFLPIEETENKEESKLNKLDNHLRENFVEEQKISIKDLLELIEEFQEE